MSEQKIQVNHPSSERASASTNLSDTSSFVVQGDLANQRFNPDLAISLYTRAIELNPSDAVAYSHRSATYGKVGCYREALEDGDKAIQANDTWNEAYYRKAVALHALNRFDEALASLEKGLTYGDHAAIREGLREVRGDKGLYRAICVDLGTSFTERFEHAKSDYTLGCDSLRLGKFEEAEQAFHRAWEVWPNNVRYFLGLADVYWEKGLWNQCISFCCQAIYMGYQDTRHIQGKDGFRMEPPLNVEQHVIGYALGLAGKAYLKQNYHLTASLFLGESLRKQPDAAIKAVVQSMSDGPLIDEPLQQDDESPGPTTNFGMTLFNLGMLFNQLNPDTNIHKAIQIKRDAVALTDDRHSHKPARLNTLSNSLIRRYELHGNVADLDEAIIVQEQAEHLTPDDSHEKAGCLYVLGNVYRLRFRHLWQVADIEKAVNLGERSVALSARSHESEKAMFLSALGDSRREQFEYSGSLADIDAAIDAHELSIQTTSSQSMHQGHRLMDLGTCLRLRFARLHENQDIDKAISTQQKALEFMDGVPFEDKASRLNNLANSFLERFEWFKAPSDIANAVKHLEEAVELTLDYHPSKYVYLSSLGISLLRRFEYSSEMADIDRAVEIQELALKLVSDDHANRSFCLGNLAAVLLRRSLCNNNPKETDEAIQALEQTVNLIPSNHPSRPKNLLNLAEALRVRFARFKRTEDIRRAIALFSEAAQSPTGPPSILFDAAANWGLYAGAAGESPLDGFRHALNLLPRVAWMGMSVFDQRVEIYRIGSIVRAAASAAIEVGEHATAVEWLEQGRQLVWSHTLQLRTPVDELRDKHPELAERLIRVSKALELAGSRDEKTSSESAIQRHHSLVHQWETLVDEVRGRPRFEDFLRPKRFCDLVAAASSGPVIVINVGQRCDGLIVMHDTDQPLHVPLTDLTNDQVVTLEQSMRNLLQAVGLDIQSGPIGPVGGATRSIGFAHSDSPDFRIRNLLAVLWNLVAKPIMDRLIPLLRSSRRYAWCFPHDPPRVWWCATGALSLLPLHAAGLYDTKSAGNKVFELVVSSYTPSLGALINARRPRQGITKCLLVGTVSSSIPKTEEELKIIAKRLGKKVPYSILKGPSATVQNVTQSMEQYGWIHLACHGEQNYENPGRSALLLESADSAELDRLELSQIVSKALPLASFAFLSACQTATGDSGLPDESVHLAAGMLLAGYSSVIATLWSIKDNDAPFVADKVYSKLVAKGHPESSRAAFALHYATKKLRESGTSFLSWVPFIHMGE